MARGHSCVNCAHNGQCADLPFCGGIYWEPESEDDDTEQIDDYDPYEQWEHDSEVWQDMMDRSH